MALIPARSSNVISWSHDDLVNLATSEWEIVSEDPGASRRINMLLHQKFPQFPHETIKNRRKTREYREVLEGVQRGHRGAAAAPPSQLAEEEGQSSAASGVPDVPAPARSKRWTNEELVRLAKIEASLPADIPDVNLQLQRRFPERSLNSIKSKRRDSSYVELVRAIRLDLAIQVPTPVQIGDVQALPDIVEEDCREVESDELAVSQTLEYLLDTVSEPDLEWFRALDNRFPYPSVSSAERELELAALLTSSKPEDAKNICTKFLMSNIYAGASLGVKAFPEEGPKKTRRASRRKRKDKIDGDGVTDPNSFLSARKRKRFEYARLQRVYAKKRSAAADRIFNDNSISDELSCTEVFNYWRNLFTQTSFEGRAMLEDFRPSSDAGFDGLLLPVEPEEVADTELDFNSAPGPDGLSSSCSRRVPVRIKCKVFTLWLRLGWVPLCVLDSRTIFLPKGSMVRTPEKLRPITISSVLLRQFHKILVARLSNTISLSEFQVGFRPLDGTAAGVYMLDHIFNNNRRKLTGLTAAILDFEKAFDSVSHEAIFDVLHVHQVPVKFIQYLKYIYQKGKTFLTFRGSTEGFAVHPSRGVRQGDPLSPLLFLMVLDSVLQRLPHHLGYPIEGRRVSHLAYADDLVLLSNNHAGLQQLLTSLERLVQGTGLRLNILKCLTLQWVKDGKNKRVLFDAEAVFKFYNRAMPAAGICQEFKYLGVLFNPEGRIYNVKSLMSDHLMKLKKAPLRPQQRFWLMKNVVIPKFLHLLVLGRTHLGLLKNLDRRVRMFIRQIFHLPKDFPNSSFYAPTGDGGLGVLSFRDSIPAMALRRIRGLPQGFSPDEVQVQRLKDAVGCLNTLAKIRTSQRRKLLENYDNKGLKQANQVPSAHRWIDDGSKFLSGRDFIHSLQIRHASLSTRSRMFRGRQTEDRTCSRGCHAVETLDHILQKCFATHGLRIRRHDSIVNYLQRSMLQRGVTTHKEPEFRTTSGKRKPDVVGYTSQVVTVVDVQIVNDQISLEAAHLAKKNYYAGNEDLVRQLAPLRPGGVMFTSLTANWRGCLSKSSVDDLLSLGLIGKKDLKIISSRILLGSFMTYRSHQNMTLKRPKKGIG